MKALGTGKKSHTSTMRKETRNVTLFLQENNQPVPPPSLQSCSWLVLGSLVSSQHVPGMLLVIPSGRGLLPPALSHFPHRARVSTPMPVDWAMFL